MKKLIYITIFSLIFICCNSNKKENIDKDSLKVNSVLIDKDSSNDNLIKIDSTNKEVTILPIHGELNRVNLVKYYPKITDTIKDLRIIRSEKLNLKPGNGILVSLLHHNTGTFDQMIICTHDKSLDLIDKLYIGKATDFDNGKSHTIEYLVINNNEIVFNQVDWGFVKKDNEEEIDTVKYERFNIKINNNGIIKTEQKEVSILPIHEELNRVNLAKFLLESELKPENVLDNYNYFNFSNIWTQTENNNVLGVIGKEHQRIQIKLISIMKNKNYPNEYLVSGKSYVKGIICDFKGNIMLTEIKEVKKLHFGVDDQYADKGIKSQGILIAGYEFHENSEQKHSGVFKGKLYSKWYVNSKNQIEYDNIEFVSDGYTNNAFVGIWQSHTTKKEKICNWADYSVPNANQDFDIGAGEFSPNEKYYNKGWKNYSKAFVFGDENAKKEELKKWWK